MFNINYFSVFYNNNNKIFFKFNNYFISRFKIFNFFFIYKFNFYSNLYLKKNLVSTNFKYINLVNINLCRNLFYFLRSSKPYKYLFYSKLDFPLYIDKKFNFKEFDFVSKDKDLSKWYSGLKDFFFFNDYYYFYKNFFILNKFKKDFLNFNFKSFYFLDFFFFYKKFKYTNSWLKRLKKFKRFIRFSLVEKKKFARNLSQWFWNTKLKYWFEYYILVKGKFTLFPFFYLCKFSPFLFFYFFISFLYSKYFWLIDYMGLKLKSFGLMFNIYLKNLSFINHKKDIFELLIFLYLFRWVIYCIDWYMACWKACFIVYGEFQHADKLDIYFTNLMIDTSLIDKWLLLNNLSGFKFSSLFTKFLFILDWNFHIRRRPWHSFYLRFYDLLVYLKESKYLSSRIIVKQFYRLFFKFMVFVKYNKFNFRKKSFKKKPIRYGFKVYF